MSPETRAKAGESNKTTWANKPLEEREAWRQRCREIKRGSKGNVENLAKGHSPEVRAKAIEASAEKRRGVELSEEQRQKISEGLKRSYAEGTRRAGHTEETKRKISETKRVATAAQGEPPKH